MSELPNSDELLSKIDYKPSPRGWMDTPVEIRKGIACYASNPKSVEYVSLPYPRKWSCFDEDWQLPENWKEIIYKGFKELRENTFLRLDAAPLERQPVRVVAERAGKVEVFFITVVLVAGNLACGSVGDLPAATLPLPPIVIAVLALDLVGRSGRAPQELRGKFEYFIL